MNKRWATTERLTGVLAVLAWLSAVIVIEGFGDTGGNESTAEELLAYFQNDENSLYIGSVLFFLGSMLIIWFGSIVRGALFDARLDRLASIAFGSSVAVGVTSMGLLAPQIGGAFGANESEVPLTPEAAQALWYAGDGFFVATEFAAASLLVAVGLAALNSRVLPTWLGWLSLVVAVVLVIPPIGWAGLIFGLPVWILLVSFFLRHGDEVRAGDRGAARPAG